MTDKEFEAFKEAMLCNDSHLFNLTEEQMDLVANTKEEVNSYYADRHSQRQAARYQERKALKSEQ